MKHTKKQEKELKRENSQQAFAHSLVKGPKFQYSWERGLKNSRKETKEENFNTLVFSLLFNYLLSILAIWSHFFVFEKNSICHNRRQTPYLITITICSCFILVFVSHIERTKQGVRKEK